MKEEDKKLVDLVKASGKEYITVRIDHWDRMCTGHCNYQAAKTLYDKKIGPFLDLVATENSQFSKAAIELLGDEILRKLFCGLDES